MNKTLLVVGAASVAAALFILACTIYQPLGALFTSGKTFVLGLLGKAQALITTNPLTTLILAPISTAVTALVMRNSALSKQSEMASVASQERTDILNNANNVFSDQKNTIDSLTAKVNSLSEQVKETADLKMEVATLQTKLSAAEQHAQRIQDEYNLAVRVKAIENSFPVENPTCH